jgi:hypothetical protein
MKSSILRLSELVGGYMHLLVDSIPEEQMTRQPAPGLNSPAWVVGHLAIAYDFGSHFLGVKRAAPKEWGPLFGPGSSPAAAVSWPSKAELLSTADNARRGLCAALEAAAPEKLAEPHTFEPMKQAAPTIGDFVAHLLTTHACSHLGQISAWRRIQGMPAVLGF